MGAGFERKHEVTFEEAAPRLATRQERLKHEAGAQEQVDMRRSAIFTGAGVIAGLSCMPTEPCACSPPPNQAVVFGSLRAANGSVVANGAVEIDVGRPGECTFTNANRSPNTTTTNATGTYRARVSTDRAGGELCVRAVGFAGAAGVSDSVRSAGVLLVFRPSTVQPDSTRIDLVLGS